MFADYRVPVVLRQLGILRYSPELAGAVDGQAPIDAGSEVENEIRGCCVAAVEALRGALEARGAGATSSFTKQLLSIELDWTLWEIGEAARLTAPPHHRTLTIFY